MLSLLEDVIRREYLSSEFESTKDLLRLLESSAQGFDLEHASVLPWIPQTIAASALRLLELDSSIIYVKLERSESHNDHLVREDMVSFLPLNLLFKLRTLVLKYVLGEHFPGLKILSFYLGM